MIWKGYGRNNIITSSYLIPLRKLPHHPPPPTHQVFQKLGNFFGGEVGMGVKLKKSTRRELECKAIRAMEMGPFPLWMWEYHQAVHNGLQWLSTHQCTIQNISFRDSSDGMKPNPRSGFWVHSFLISHTLTFNGQLFFFFFPFPTLSLPTSWFSLPLSPPFLAYKLVFFWGTSSFSFLWFSIFHCFLFCVALFEVFVTFFLKF